MSRAGTGARDQVARLLTLVPLLHARDALGVGEAAAAIGTSPAQVVKDLKVLFMCGLPGGYPDDLIDVDLEALAGPGAEGTIHVRNANYLARPVRLSSTEATALVVALRTIRDSSGVQARSVVDRALAKLEQATAEGSAHDQVAVSDVGDVDSARVEAELRRATEGGRRVRLGYWVPTRDEKTDRVVDPIQVSHVRGITYLEAHCHRARARRVFRLDRVDDVEVLNEAVGPDAHVEPSDLSATLFDAPSYGTAVTLLVDPLARWIYDYYPVDAVREQPDGSVEVDLQVSDPRWLAQLVLRLAPHARVVAPSDLADTGVDSARRALGHYS